MADVFKQDTVATVRDSATVVLISPIAPSPVYDRSSLKDVAQLNLSTMGVPLKVDKASIKDLPTVTAGLCRQQVTQVLTEIESTDVGTRQVTQILAEVEVRIDMWLSPQDTATIQDVATIELESFVSSPVDSATISDVATLEFDEAIELPIQVDSSVISDTATIEVWWDPFLEHLSEATIQDIPTVDLEGGEEVSPDEISKTDKAQIKDQPNVFIYDFIGNQFVSQVLSEVESDNVGERQVTQVLSEVDSYNIGNRWVSQILIEVEYTPIPNYGRLLSSIGTPSEWGAPTGMFWDWETSIFWANISTDMSTPPSGSHPVPGTMIAGVAGSTPWGMVDVSKMYWDDSTSTLHVANVSDEIPAITLSSYPGLGQMIAQVGDPLEWGLIDYNRMRWDDANSTLRVSNLNNTVLTVQSNRRDSASVFDLATIELS